MKAIEPSNASSKKWQARKRFIIIFHVVKREASKKAIASSIEPKLAAAASSKQVKFAINSEPKMCYLLLLLAGEASQEDIL